MNHETTCRDDCAHKEKGRCKLNIGTKNSIFPQQVKPCIYYAARRKNTSDHPDTAAMM